MNGPVPPAPKKGALVLGYLKELEKWLRTLVPHAGKGIRITRSAGGAAISAHIPTLPKEPPPAFRVSTFLDDDTVVAVVVPGTVNNFEPETAEPYDGEDWQMQLELDDDNYVYLRASLAPTGIIEEAEDVEIYITQDEEDQSPGDPDTGAPPAYAYLKLAKVAVTDEGVATVTQYITGSQWVSLLESLSGCTQNIRNIVWTPA